MCEPSSCSMHGWLTSSLQSGPTRPAGKTLVARSRRPSMSTQARKLEAGARPPWSRVDRAPTENIQTGTLGLGLVTKTDKLQLSSKLVAFSHCLLPLPNTNDNQSNLYLSTVTARLLAVPHHGSMACFSHLAASESARRALRSGLAAHYSGPSCPRHTSSRSPSGQRGKSAPSTGLAAHDVPDGLKCTSIMAGGEQIQHCPLDLRLVVRHCQASQLFGT